jgi:hypothetical protein
LHAIGFLRSGGESHADKKWRDAELGKGVTV